MNPPNNQILSVAEVVAAEQRLMDSGITAGKLMQRAGRGAANWVRRIAAGKAVTVLCGPGNNGGDGYVIAEELRQSGLDVAVVAPMDPATDEATAARERYLGKVEREDTGRTGAILVDCLFGSGLSRPLSDDLATRLRRLSERHDYLIAIDLPSGISSDDGRPLNTDLPNYDLTLALGAWKYAHWLMPASAVMGNRRLVPLGVDTVSEAVQVLVRPHFRAPDPDAHKYKRGLCVITAGSMPGATLLACKSAMRSGSGYVKLASSGDHPAAPPDLVIDAEALSDERAAAILVGPGLGRDDAARERLEKVLAADLPAVIDADALALLRPKMLSKNQTYIATPHEGELAALCENFHVTESGKLEQAKLLAKTSGMVIVAKGPDTIIAAPDGRTAIAPPASSWLSVAGTGDVLAGIIVSRLATGAEPFAAACEGVWLHSDAGRLAGGPFTASQLAGKVTEAYAACL